MSLVEPLASRQLLVVTGKGGVGKSAVAAALGRLLHALGRQVLVLEIDPRENAHRMLGAPPSGGEVLEVTPGLLLQNLQPRVVLDQVVRERVRFDFIIRKVLASPIYRHFSEGAPGLKEMAILGHALLMVEGRAARGPRVDSVVLDAPATGHGVSLLEAPLLVSEAVGQGPVAEMAGEVADLVASSARCGLVVVTVAEEMAVGEALELRVTLEARLDRRPDLLIVNGLYPPVGGRAEDRTGEDPAVRLWHERRRVNERQLERLGAEWLEPRIEVPLLPLCSGPELVGSVMETLVAQ